MKRKNTNNQQTEKNEDEQKKCAKETFTIFTIGYYVWITLSHLILSDFALRLHFEPTDSSFMRITSRKNLNRTQINGNGFCFFFVFGCCSFG